MLDELQCLSGDNKEKSKENKKTARLVAGINGDDPMDLDEDYRINTVLMPRVYTDVLPRYQKQQQKKTFRKVLTFRKDKRLISTSHSGSISLYSGDSNSTDDDDGDENRSLASRGSDVSSVQLSVRSEIADNFKSRILQTFDQHITFLDEEIDNLHNSILAKEAQVVNFVLHATEGTTESASETSSVASTNMVLMQMELNDRAAALSPPSAQQGQQQQQQHQEPLLAQDFLACDEVISLSSDVVNAAIENRGVVGGSQTVLASSQSFPHPSGTTGTTQATRTLSPTTATTATATTVSSSNEQSHATLKSDNADAEGGRNAVDSTVSEEMGSSAKRTASERLILTTGSPKQSATLEMKSLSITEKSSDTVVQMVDETSNRGMGVANLAALQGNKSEAKSSDVSDLTTIPRHGLVLETASTATRENLEHRRLDQIKTHTSFDYAESDLSCREVPLSNNTVNGSGQMLIVWSSASTVGAAEDDNTEKVEVNGGNGDLSEIHTASDSSSCFTWTINVPKTYDKRGSVSTHESQNSEYTAGGATQKGDAGSFVGQESSNRFASAAESAPSLSLQEEPVAIETNASSSRERPKSTSASRGSRSQKHDENHSLVSLSSRSTTSTKGVTEYIHPIPMGQIQTIDQPEPTTQTDSSVHVNGTGHVISRMSATAPLHGEQQPTPPMYPYANPQQDGTRGKENPKTPPRMRETEKADFFSSSGFYKPLLPRFPLPPTDVIEIPDDGTVGEAVSIVTTPEQCCGSESSLHMEETEGSMKDKLTALRAEVKAMEQQLQSKLEEKTRVLRARREYKESEDEDILLEMGFTNSDLEREELEYNREECRDEGVVSVKNNFGEEDGGERIPAVLGQTGCFACLQWMFCL